MGGCGELTWKKNQKKNNHLLFKHISNQCCAAYYPIFVHTQLYKCRKLDRIIFTSRVLQNMKWSLCKSWFQKFKKWVIFFQKKCQKCTTDPPRVPAHCTNLKPVWLHLIGHTLHHCGLTEGRLAVTHCVWPGHGGECIGGEYTDSSWHLAPPRPPLWSGPLALGAGAPNRPLPLVCASDQPIQRGGGRGLVQVLRKDQRLPVVLLRDGEHRHTDVITLTWKVVPLSSLAALCLALSGSRRARAAFWGGALGMGNTGGLCWVCSPGQQAKARPREAWASQVAGGVETPLPLGRLCEGVGGIADGRVGDDAVVCLGLQVNVREDLPAVGPSAVCCQTRWSLEWWCEKSYLYSFCKMEIIER